MDKQCLKQIRQMMQTPQWSAFEMVLDDYLKRNFLDSSMKKANEFETIWWTAYAEGGKFHLKDFMQKLETNVMNLND